MPAGTFRVRAGTFASSGPKGFCPYFDISFVKHNLKRALYDLHLYILYMSNYM